jgi:plasmid stability protein
MARLTITLSDETHRNLKVRAALHDRTIGDLIEEELAIAREARLARIKATFDEASRNAAEFFGDMTEDEIMDWAVEQTRAVRAEMAQERRTANDHR